MIKVENIAVDGFEAAIRGMRNPKRSWSRIDSHYCDYEIGEYCDQCGKLAPDNTGECIGQHKEFYVVGSNDTDLMQRLYKAGTEHRKYLRMIHVSMDITAPAYFWPEYDSYKIGVTRNSTSFMHKGTSKEYSLDDFSTHMSYFNKPVCDCEPDSEIVATYNHVLKTLNDLREQYLETKDPEIFEQIRCLLPSGYNIRATVDFNYENVFNMIHQRSEHRLKEWRDFVHVLHTLPYVDVIGQFSKVTLDEEDLSE